jgi:hypothetical protein
VRFAIVSSALIAARGRMDASYWVPVMAECAKQGVDPNDIERVMGVARTYEALHNPHKPRLGDLVQRAAAFDKEPA